MRLLHTTRLELYEFQDTPPPYAILSHTWGEEEVTFPEVGILAAQAKRGYEKIVKCCARAKGDSLDYVWIDTCCIDKRSSAELSEAINSMFRWYSEAHVCYAFLEDVDLRLNSQMEKSRWFTRGWTLQELVAPLHVLFFDQNWNEFGSKVNLLQELNRITGVPQQALLRPDSIYQYCVAERMFWAHQRKTTRVEDNAYCLLGIFGVNMPLLYGEGTKAFRRLQLQILSESDDQSIFAWEPPFGDDTSKQKFSCDMLAPSPAYFNFHPIVRTNSKDDLGTSSMPTPEDATMMLTNIGISMRLAILSVPELKHHKKKNRGGRAFPPGMFIAVLNCRCLEKHICIQVRRSRLYSEAWTRKHGAVLSLLDNERVRKLRTDPVIMTLSEPEVREHSDDKIMVQPIFKHDEAARNDGITIIWIAFGKDWNRVHDTSLPRILLDTSRGSAFMLTDKQRTAFVLVVGMLHRRIWSYGFTCPVPPSLAEIARPIWGKYIEEVESIPWKYYQDQATYEFDERHQLQVTIKPVAVSRGDVVEYSQQYKVEILLKHNADEV